MSVLTGPTRQAQSGEAKSLVILLHGYGADGNDLIGLADPLGPHLPDTQFVAPNAPMRCHNNPMGYQWFSIPFMDGTSEVQAGAEMASAVVDLNETLDALAADTGIAPENTILLGFSQGTMMSLHVGPTRATAYAGIVGFSGRLLQPETLAQAASKPPILLVHGDQDDLVPPASMGDAADALTGAGFEVYTHMSKGTGHGIAPDGLGLAMEFMRTRL